MKSGTNEFLCASGWPGISLECGAQIRWNKNQCKAENMFYHTIYNLWNILLHFLSKKIFSACTIFFGTPCIDLKTLLHQNRLNPHILQYLYNSVSYHGYCSNISFHNVEISRPTFILPISSRHLILQCHHTIILTILIIPLFSTINIVHILLPFYIGLYQHVYKWFIAIFNMIQATCINFRWPTY